MNSISEAVTDVKDKVLGNETSNETSQTSSGVEPPSGVSGKGTVDSPYDQGNAPEQAAGPGIEPPSGQKGEGTVDSPYDQGNAPENPPTSIYSAATTSQPTPTPSVPIRKPQGIEVASPSPTQAPAQVQTPELPVQSQPKHKPQGIEIDRSASPAQAPSTPETRGRDSTTQSTTSTSHLAPPGQVPIKSRLERSVSPGQLDDGTHVRTSGDKGQSYEPGNNLKSKMKEKFHFGRGH